MISHRYLSLNGIFALRSLMVVITTAMLISCDEYTSQVPITIAPTDEIDSTYFGDWYLMTDDELGSYFESKLSLYPWGDGTYLVLFAGFLEEGKGMSEALAIKVHVSDVLGDSYLNVFNIRDPDGYQFYVMNRQSAEQLSLSYITDSFNVNFQSSEAFYRHLLSHKGEFDAAIKKDWTDFFRDTYWTWRKANEVWIGQIDSFYEIVDSVSIATFFDSGLDTVVRPATSVLLDREALLQDWSRYHLHDYPGTYQRLLAGFLGGRMQPSHYFIIRMQDGSLIRYLKAENYLIDVTRDRIYILFSR